MRHSYATVRLTIIRGVTQQYVAEAYRVIACLW
jgi:hypothetical protein